MTEAEISRAANELHNASSRYLEQLPRIAPGLYKMGELPEVRLEDNKGWHEMRAIGERLAAQPGNAMSEVYDIAVERYGYRGVRGVSSAWTGIGGWAA